MIPDVAILTIGWLKINGHLQGSSFKFVIQQRFEMSQVMAEMLKITIKQRCNLPNGHLG